MGDVWTFQCLINVMKNMNKEYSTLEKNKKFMNALFPESKIKVISIEEAKIFSMAHRD